MLYGRNQLILAPQSGAMGYGFPAAIAARIAHPGRVSGTEIANPDFAALAHSHGHEAEKVTSTAEFAEAFERATRSPTGAVLHLVVGGEMITPNQSIAETRAAE